MSRLQVISDLESKGLPELSGNIYCIGRNYRAHAEELGNEVPIEEPVVFLKSPSSLRSWTDGPMAFADETFHHEIEVVLLMGGQDAKGSLPLGVVAATLGLDLTRRGLQSQLKAKGLPWAKCKNFTGSSVLAPWTSCTAETLVKPIDMQLLVNGDKRQKGTTSHMIFSFEAIISFLEKLHPLEPGDVIFTGTPEGVGPIKSGDLIHGKSQALSIDIAGRL